MLRICIWTLKISNIYSNRVHICKTTSDQTSKQIFLIFFSGCWGRRWAYWIVYCSQWHGRINVLWNDFGQNACFQNDHIGCVFHEFCWNDCLHVYYELWLYCSSLLHCLSLRVSFKFIIWFIFKNLNHTLISKNRNLYVHFEIGYVCHYNLYIVPALHIHWPSGLSIYVTFWFQIL